MREREHAALLAILVATLSACWPKAAEDYCWEIQHASSDWRRRCYADTGYGLFIGGYLSPGGAFCDSMFSPEDACPAGQALDRGTADACLDQLAAATCTESEPPPGSACATLCR